MGLTEARKLLNLYPIDLKRPRDLRTSITSQRKGSTTPSAMFPRSSLQRLKLGLPSTRKIKGITMGRAKKCKGTV